MWPMENLSFCGKPHLRCQTSQMQCWKTKIFACKNIFSSKYIILSGLVTVYIQHNSYCLMCYTRSPSVEGEPNQAERQSIAVFVFPFHVSVVLLADNKGDGRNQTVDHAAHLYAALLWQFSLLFSAVWLHLGLMCTWKHHWKWALPLGCEFGTRNMNSPYSRVFHVTFLHSTQFHLFVLLCRFVPMTCWPRRNRSACCSEPSESAKASSRRSTRFLVSEKPTVKEFF